MASQAVVLLIGAALALALRYGGMVLMARVRTARSSRVVQERLTRYCPPQR